jgi:hypothetical protein
LLRPFGARPAVLLPVILFCLSLALLGFGAVIKGPIYGVDSKGYLTVGGKFLQWMAHGPPEGHHLDELFIVPNYVISTVVLTGIHSSLGAGAAGVVILNSLLYSLVVCMVFSMCNALYGVYGRIEGAAGVSAFLLGGLYIVFGLPDAFQWSYAVLTDAMFAFWVAVFVFATVRGLLEARRGMWMLSAVMAIAAPFVRPPGILVPLLYLFALGIHVLPAMRQRFAGLVIASVAVPAALVFVVIPWLVTMAAGDPSFPSHWILGPVRGYFMQMVVFFSHGTVVADRLQFPVSEPVTYLEVVKMIVIRLAYFWVPLRVGAIPYSAMHNAVNLVYVVLTWPLAVVGAIRLLRADDPLRRMTGLFLLMVAYSYALLHSVTLVSYDWRYQLPAIVPYWVLAGCGYCHLMDLVAAGWRGRPA